MAIKPSPTIAGKLRKLFSNNKQTIEPAIGDGAPGGSGGGNVLTLYLGEKENMEDAFWAYKNQECTEEYLSFDEACSAVNNATCIILIDPESDEHSGHKYFMTDIQWGANPGRVGGTTLDGGDPIRVILFIATSNSGPVAPIEPDPGTIS